MPVTLNYRHQRLMMMDSVVVSDVLTGGIAEHAALIIPSDLMELLMETPNGTSNDAKKVVNPPPILFSLLPLPSLICALVSLGPE